MSFSSALKAAADKSFAEGSITNVSHAALSAVAADPHMAPAAEAAAAWQIGKAIGSIDWLKLVSQIQTVLPFILQLIALFSKQPVPPPAPPPAPAAPQGAALGATP